MKKIVHLTSAHPHDDIRILVKECNSLSLAGYDVTLVHASSASFVNDKGVKIVGLNLPVINRLDRFTKVVNKVGSYALSLNADLYQLHDPELIRIIPLLKSSGAKVIFDAHENLPKQIATKKWIPNPLKRTTSWFVTKILNHYCSKADGIITVNEMLVATYQQINKNTAAVHNYPLLSEFDFSNQSSNLGEDLIYVGGLMESRGILKMLDVLEQSNCKIKLAGKFENESFRTTCINHPAWNKVNYLGFLDRVAVANEIAKSLCGVIVLKPYETYLESTPIKLFEYMAGGLPVIASDFPYWKQILQGIDCVYWVDSENTDQIISIIREIQNDKSNARIKGELGRKAVQEKFNWETEQLSLLRYYETVFNG